MSFLWNALDYIPVVGSVKNAGQAVVALVEGDFRRAASKTVEAAVGGTLDYMTLGAGKALATAVVKESGKVFAKEMSKMAAKKTAVAGSVAAATAVRVIMKRGRSPSPSNFRGSRGNITDGSSDQQDRSRKQERSSGRDRTEKPTTGGSKQDPNDKDNNGQVPKRGYHIINNDILKLFRKVLNTFMQSKGFSYLMLKNAGTIGNDSQIYQDYNNPLPQEIFNDIEKELVVRTCKVLKDPNAASYGDHRQRLEKACLKYMEAIYNGYKDAYDPKEIEDLVNNARNNVTSLTEKISCGEIFVDKTALLYWLTDDLNEHFPSKNSNRTQKEKRNKKYEHAKQAVKDMLKGMTIKAEVWVHEFLKARDKYLKNSKQNN